MTKQKNYVIDKEQYKHYLIDEVESLKKEVETLMMQILSVKKEIDTLKRKLNILQTKYDKSIESH